MQHYAVVWPTACYGPAWVGTGDIHMQTEALTPGNSSPELIGKGQYSSDERFNHLVTIALQLRGRCIAAQRLHTSMLRIRRAIAHAYDINSGRKQPSPAV